MKKVMLVFAVLFISFNFVSCSNDDGGTPDVLDDSIYGTWKTEFTITNGSINEDLTCSEIVEYDFNNDGSFELTSFTGDDVENCTATTTAFGEFEYLGEDLYLIYPNGTDLEGNQDAYTYYLVFDNNVMRMYTLSNHNNEINTYTRFQKQ